MTFLKKWFFSWNASKGEKMQFMIAIKAVLQSMLAQTKAL